MFWDQGKLSPRYIGPFEILDRIGAVAYRLALSPSLSGVHDVFHVSQLRRYIRDPSHVLDHCLSHLIPCWNARLYNCNCPDLPKSCETLEGES